MNTKKNHEPKRWVLLDQLPYQYSKRLLLILFLYALAFTLLLVGLRMFCHNLQTTPEQSQQATTKNQNKNTLNMGNLSNTQNIENTFDIPTLEQTGESNLPMNPDKQSIDHAAQIQQDIADQIIRLHVIAHSDTDEDQALKLKVRNEVLAQIQNSLLPADTQTEAETILDRMIPAIQNIAQNKIQAEGYNYPIRVVMEERYFPAKTYGDLTFPPGSYQALCIEIGNAEGKNWWCVLFPSLCFVNEITAEVPESSKEKLEDSLSEEAYHSLSNQSTPTPSPSVKPEFHSAIYDWFQKR